jgi:hypothetical protein
MSESGGACIDSRHAEHVALAALTVLGLSFWFWMGFPFGNHNESYVWVAYLKKWTFVDAFASRIFAIQNFRPLAQLLAWITFKAGGDSGVVTQVVNYLGGIAAWVVLLGSSNTRRTFSLLAVIVGGVFFSGYIYLFHLHGVFYSPLLLLLAYMILRSERPFSETTLLLIAVLAFLVSLVHPFASLIYIGYVAGILAEKGKELRRYGRWMAYLSIPTFLLVILGALLTGQTYKTELDPWTYLTGAWTSYKMVMVHPLVSLVAAGLSVVALGDRFRSRGARVALVLATLALSVLLYRIGIPVILLWLAVSLARALFLRRWVFVSLIVVTSALPASYPSGSPTYTVFVLMVCCAVTAAGTALPERLARLLQPRYILALLLVSALSLTLVRLDVSLPGLSRVAQPLLAEREKTIQLESVITWVMGSGYQDYDLILERNASQPRVSRDAIDRRLRPPASQENLDYYMGDLRLWKPVERGTHRTLRVSFGETEGDGEDVVYAITSKHAGWAVVREGLPSR